MRGDRYPGWVDGRLLRAVRCPVHPPWHPAESALRGFVNAKHLARIVATDMENEDTHWYMPMNNALVDAWCICSIDNTWTVVGLQVATSKLENPIAGENVAKEEFNAIHGALATRKVKVHKAAWLVFVLPPDSYSKFPHQCATAGPGEQQRTAGHIRPHTQAKLAKQLDHQGKPPANVAAMRDMCAEGTTVELSAGVTAGDLCTLHHMGRIRAAQLPSVLYANTRDESKPLENFLDSLENSHKALAGVLKHESNQGRWSYGGQVWSGSARAPAPTRTAGRPKRRAEVDGAAGGRSRYTKRARRRTLTGAIHVADK